MLKQPGPTPRKTTQVQISPLFGEAKLVLDETPTAISPFRGLASFISFLWQIRFPRKVQQRMPFAEPASNKAIPLAQTPLRRDPGLDPHRRTPRGRGVHAPIVWLVQGAALCGRARTGAREPGGRGPHTS